MNKAFITICFWQSLPDLPPLGRHVTLTAFYRLVKAELERNEISCQITGNVISEGLKFQNFLGEHAPRPPQRETAFARSKYSPLTLYYSPATTILNEKPVYSQNVVQLKCCKVVVFYCCTVVVLYSGSVV